MEMNLSLFIGEQINTQIANIVQILILQALVLYFKASLEMWKIEFKGHAISLKKND